MKTLKFVLSSLAAVAAGLLLATTRVQAQTNAYDDAFHYTKTNWNQTNLVVPNYNGGFGFTPWVLTTNGPSSHGFFTTRGATPLPAISSPTNSSTTGSAPGNDNNAHVWGLFANGAGANSAVAYRGFSNSLTTNVVFKLAWESLGVGSSSSKLGGFVLRNGNPTNGTSDYLTAQRFAFYYVGGGVNSFVYWDNNGVQPINVPFASNPLACEFTLEANDTYRFVVKSLASGSILAVVDGQPLQGSGTIDSVALFANETDGNQNFNRMQIVSASLIPPTIINVSPTNGSVYVDPTSQNVSFEVDSLASTISSNGISLVLNGVTQTNLRLNTSGATNQLFITNATTLAANVFYNASILATDANGNRATNNFSFNTFLQTDNFIEAEDYNFGGGQFVTPAFPDAYGAYADLPSGSGFDYFDLTPTNLNVYRDLGDLTQVLAGNDPLDHAGYAAGSYADYYIGYTDTGEWEDYTRVLPVTNFTVYARMAGFGTSPIMELEHLATATATGGVQPNAALGRFNCPATGGTANYVLVPLTDVLGNTVQMNFSSTNTFRCTAVGGNRAYNFNYLILVPNTNTATLRPYVSVGSPASGSTGVALDKAISFTIANRQTTVNPGTIQLLVNSSNVTSSLSVSNNAAGSQVSYVPASLLAPNTTYTLSAIYTDSASVSLTNTWQFTTLSATITVIPAADAKPIGSGSTIGFALTIYKVDDAAATTASLANAEIELAGQRIDPNTSLPYPNLAGGPNSDGLYLETNTINYDITGNPTGTPTFPYKSAFPYVAAGNPNNNIALQALMYVQLNTGFYHFAVRSDDGFKLTAGTNTTDTSLVLGSFDAGRGNGAASDIYFQVLTNGLYPMRLLYYQAGSGGNVEFYSITANGNSSVLINDSTNVASIKVFASLASPATPVTILSPAHSGNATTFHFQTQNGHTHYVEYKVSLSDATWTPLQTVNGDGTVANISDSGATSGSRYYRVRTQ